jgi:hypothetical protein
MLMKTVAYVLLTYVLFASGAATLAAPAQDQTQQPGQPTQARVWIQNRGVTEAVPVAIQPLASDAPPLPVEVTGIPTVSIGSSTVVQVRAAREPWEYRDINIPSGQGVASLLNAAGADGWETTGVALALQNGTIVVMKRPR